MEVYSLGSSWQSTILSSNIWTEIFKTKKVLTRTNHSFTISVWIHYFSSQNRKLFIVLKVLNQTQPSHVSVNFYFYYFKFKAFYLFNSRDWWWDSPCELIALHGSKSCLSMRATIIFLPDTTQQKLAWQDNQDRPMSGLVQLCYFQLVKY